MARLLLESGVSCDVFLHGSADRISGAALLAYEAWRQIAPERERSSDDWLNSARQGEEYDVLVDALVGIGFRGPARSEFDALVEGINEASIPVLSLDVPSGLNADTGAVDSSVIQAHSTVTFIAMKPGLLTGRAPDVAGRLILDSLDTPQFILDASARGGNKLGARPSSCFLTTSPPNDTQGCLRSCSGGGRKHRYGRGIYFVRLGSTPQWRGTGDIGYTLGTPLRCHITTARGHGPRY